MNQNPLVAADPDDSGLLQIDLDEKPELPAIEMADGVLKSVDTKTLTPGTAVKVTTSSGKVYTFTALPDGKFSVQGGQYTTPINLTACHARKPKLNELAYRNRLCVGYPVYAKLETPPKIGEETFGCSSIKSMEIVPVVT